MEFLALIIILAMIAVGIGRARRERREKRERDLLNARYQPPDRGREMIPIGRPNAAATQPAPQIIRTKVPDIGAPGSITENQVYALNRNGFDDLSNLSFEQASCLISALSYTREVYRTIGGDDSKPSLDVQNPVIAKIMGDSEIRDYVYKWSEDRFRRGTHHDPARLRRNDHYKTVREALEKRLR